MLPFSTVFAESSQQFAVEFDAGQELIPVEFDSGSDAVAVDFEAEQDCLPVEFDAGQDLVEVEFGISFNIGVNAEIYSGPYQATPLITAQTLPTAEKYLEQNVRIEMIPTREIDNAGGGVTFIVG